MTEESKKEIEKMAEENKEEIEKMAEENKKETENMAEENEKESEDLAKNEKVSEDLVEKNKKDSEVLADKNKKDSEKMAEENKEAGLVSEEIKTEVATVGRRPTVARAEARIVEHSGNFVEVLEITMDSLDVEAVMIVVDCDVDKVVVQSEIGAKVFVADAQQKKCVPKTIRRNSWRCG